MSRSGKKDYAPMLHIHRLNVILISSNVVVILLTLENDKSSYGLFKNFTSKKMTNIWEALIRYHSFL